MWPFGSSDECDGHHWDDGSPTGHYRLMIQTAGLYKADEKVRHRCQHDNCTAHRDSWERVDYGDTRADVKESLASHIEENGEFRP